MYKAVIFDMDGVLIDSEPFWQDAEIETFNRYGIPMTRDMCRQVMGLRIDEVVDHWLTHYKVDHSNSGEIIAAIQNHVIRLIHENGQPMTGVIRLLNHLKINGFWIALASSSSRRIIDAVVEQLQIRQYFEVIRSAETEKFGKPHPAIYLSTLNDLGMDRREVLVVEDSYNGAMAAKAARMHVAVIPENKVVPKNKFGFADYQVGNLVELIPVLS
jgi:sugar-phosphatase